MGFQKSFVIFRVGHGKCLHLITRWVGGVKKGPKHAYVIFEGSLRGIMKVSNCSFKIDFNPLCKPAMPRLFLKSNLAWRSPVEPSAPLTRLLQEVVVFLTLDECTVQVKSKHHEKIINSLNSINSLKSSAPLMLLLQEVKVSKSQKQIILSSHTPKNQQKFSHFFALAPKSGRIKKIKVVYCVK